MSLIRLRGTGSAVQILAVLLLPLVFSVVGAWETVRGDNTVAELSLVRGRVAGQLDRLQVLARNDPQAQVRFGHQPQSYAASVAARMMADGKDRLDTDVAVARVRVPFAWLATVAGLVALAGGVLGLALVAHAARRSMRSRDVLVRAFDQVRRLVPVALALQVAGVALALLGIVAFEGGGLWFLETVSGGEVKVVVAGLAAAGLALWGAFGSIRQLRRAFELFEPEPAQLLGVPLTEADAPGLFGLVRELARERDAVVPDTVVAGALAGFFVTSYPQRLPIAGRVVDGRTLHVSLPHLAVLSRAETRVILAHELAHFSGEDTAYSSRFQPVYAGLQRSMVAVAGRTRHRQPLVDRALRPALALGEYVLERFDRIVKHWSRLREFEADKAAWTTEAPDALATSLLRTAVTSEIVNAQLKAMAELPARAPADLMEQVLGIAAQQGFVEPGRHVDERQPHPTDTHPPTAQRIQAAGVVLDDALLARAARPVDPEELASVRALFADWSGLCATVTAQLREVMVKREQDHRQRVAAAAAAVSEAPVELREQRTRILVTLGFAILFCLGLAGGLAWLTTGNMPSTPGDNTNQVLLWSAVAAVTGAVAAIVGLVRFARNRLPFLVLDADGFSSPGFVGVVPWSAVVGVTVVSSRGVTTVLKLAPDHPLPSRTGRIWRLRARRRRNTLVFSGLTPQGMKPQNYLDLLLRYRRAALARTELARMEQS